MLPLTALNAHSPVSEWVGFVNGHYILWSLVHDGGLFSSYIKPVLGPVSQKHPSTKMIFVSFTWNGTTIILALTLLWEPQPLNFSIGGVRFQKFHMENHLGSPTASRTHWSGRVAVSWWDQSRCWGPVPALEHSGSAAHGAVWWGRRTFPVVQSRHRGNASSPCRR